MQNDAFLSIVDVCSDRGLLVQEDAARTDTSFGRSLIGGEYENKLDELAAALNSALPKLYVNILNEPLLKSKVQIKISYETDMGDVRRTEEGYLIRIGADFIRAIDLAAIGMTVGKSSIIYRKFLHNSGSKRKNGKPWVYDNVSAETLLKSILEGYGMEDPSGLWQSVRCFGEKPNKLDVLPVREVWAAKVASMIVWVLSHEIAHIVCGHLGYRKHLIETGGQPENEKNWASELMSDSYATISLALIVDRAIHSGDELADVWAFPGFVESLLLTPLVPISLMLGIANKEYSEKSDEATEAGISFKQWNPTHPTALCRFLNCLAAFYFCMVPLHNAFVLNSLIPNLFTKRLTTLSKYEMGSDPHAWEIFGQLLSLFDNWAHIGLVDEGEAACISADLETIWGNVILMRIGLTTFAHGDDFIEHLNSSKYPITVNEFEGNQQYKHWNGHLLQWARTAHVLCTEGNAAFAWHIPPEVTVDDLFGFIRDHGVTSGAIAWERQTAARPNETVPHGVDGKTYEGEQEYKQKLFEKILNGEPISEKDPLIERLISISTEKHRYVIDPVYSLLDNWMSQIYYTTVGNRYIEGQFDIRDDYWGSLIVAIRAVVHFRSAGN